MDVLLIIDRKLDSGELIKIKSMFKNMTIIADDQFETACRTLEGQSYKLVVFMTFDEQFDQAWKIDQLQTDSPIMILLKVNKFDLFVFFSFLDSIGLLTPGKPVRSSSSSQEHPLLLKSLEFIEENLQENELSLEMVASSVFVSRCHYSRMFKQYFGIRFKEYVMNKRIQKAKVMLQEGQAVTEVCYAVGYGDLTHFGRVFKRLVGVNPSVYRRMGGN